MKSIPAGNFKTHCLGLMDEVERTRQPIVITKRGKPIAKLVPVDSAKDDLIGSWAGSVRIVGDIVAPAFDPDDWDLLK